MSITARAAALFRWPGRFALTISALLCLVVDRTLALDALGAPGAVLLALLRAFLAPFNFLHHALFRISIAFWAQSTPAWWNWLSVLLGLLLYTAFDILIAASHGDRVQA